MDPQQAAIAKEFDAYRDRYEEAVNEAIGFSGLKVDFFVRAKAQHLLDRLSARFGDLKPSLLDIGCGIGQYHPLLAGRVAGISGVDVSAEAIDRARENNPDVDYRVYDGTALPYEDGAFDAAFAICVLHHVPPAQWANFASEMRRVVRPGGVAFLFEHNPRHFLTLKAVKSCPFDRDAVLVSTRAAEDLFREAGFDKLDLRHILTVPAISGLPKRLDNALSVFRFGVQYCLEAEA